MNEGHVSVTQLLFVVLVLYVVSNIDTVGINGWSHNERRTRICHIVTVCSSSVVCSQ